MKQLELDSLVNACNALSDAVAISQDEAFTARLTPEQRQLMTAGVIQTFEFSYELCIKMLRRYLEQIADVPAEVARYSFRELIRSAAEQGLVTDPEAWFIFRQQRNITSHTYDNTKAQDVYSSALAFEPHATFVLNALQARLSGKEGDKDAI